MSILSVVEIFLLLGGTKFIGGITRCLLFHDVSY